MPHSAFVIQAASFSGLLERFRAVGSAGLQACMPALRGRP